MRPCTTETTTESLGAPADWNDLLMGRCEDLPICRAHGMIFSYWLPDEEELARIVAGHPIRLGVLGERHPVVSIDTQL